MRDKAFDWAKFLRINKAIYLVSFPTFAYKKQIYIK